jgi:NAD-dependent deacetylase
VATLDGFARNPDRVHDFYNARRRGLLDAAVQPNPAHRALAELERRWPGPVLLVTQNIDDLHERAGSAGPVHMHGELLKVFCTFCRVVERWQADLGAGHTCSSCGRTGGMRPDIVWFGEVPYRMDEIFDALQTCDLFVSIGTSGNVYPASGFVAEARASGAHTVELNLEPSAGASLFAECIEGPASVVVPEFVDALLKRLDSPEKGGPDKGKPAGPWTS